ncbi:MAG: DUF4065 domain-containing protein [Candidatus Hydrogenedentes bacterium]|nr:DUF4065 domain-containing protein [Candidatus Hydrogenedentota bacterium]
MATAHDVAAFILQRKGPMTAMKLQKLVYYSQAWSLAWDDAPLFDEVIEAWANGPVVPELFDVHRGQYTVRDWPKGNPSSLSQVQLETINAVLDFYGDKNSRWLSDLTHNEDPWKDARKGLSPNDRGSSVITHDAMAWYYQSLSANG